MSGVILQHHRKRKRITASDIYSLTLHSKRSKTRPCDNSDQESTSGFTAKIVFQILQRKSNLVLSVNQTRTVAGSFLQVPRLAVHNVVPNDSPIFNLAAEGNLQGMLELFRNGKASLNDRDEKGWSILHVRPARLTCLPLIQDFAKPLTGAFD